MTSLSSRLPRLLLGAVLALTLFTATVAPAASAAAAALPSSLSPAPSVVTRSDVQAAADVLMTSYDTGKAWFPSSWWNSAVAMQTIGDYAERTGDRRHLSQLDLTFEQDQGVFPAGELSGDPLLGSFTSRAIDDSEWWGLTWIQAYDLTGERKYLDMAKRIGAYVNGFWDTSTCGGGVWWDAERTYKNAVTNGLWVRLTAELHNRLPHDRLWLGRATTAWSWFTASGLIGPDGLVNDGLTADCRNNGSTVWSYNQGLAVGAGLEVWRATRDPRALATARRLADAGTTSPSLVADGVLTESCDAVDRTCDDNAKQFKGVFARYLMDLADTTGSARDRAVVERQARSVLATDRDDLGRLGVRWAGADPADHPNVRDWRTQASALSALVAALPARHPDRTSLSAAVTPTSSVVLASATAGTTLPLTLSVVATSPATARVHLRATAPAGWVVSPPRGDLAIPSRGRTVAQRHPFTVTVPPGAGDGTYVVTVTADSGGGHRGVATTHVTVTGLIAFATGTDAETPWLVDADGSQSSGPGNRFADGTAHFTYRFPLPPDTSAATVTLAVDNEFLVEVSGDGEHWTTALREEREVTDGSNAADRTIDLALGPDRVAWVRVSDSRPADGWGGRVSHVAVATT